jgi:endonuclease III
MNAQIIQDLNKHLKALEKATNRVLFNKSILDNIARRKAGHIFTLSEHVEAMVYAMLSARIKWDKVDKKRVEIAIIFGGFDIGYINNHNADHFHSKLKSIGLDNLVRRKQMAVLHKNITLMQNINIEEFVTSTKSWDVIKLLSTPKSPYKLEQLGIPLICEYLLGVGIDRVKPDTHIVRFFNRFGEKTDYKSIWDKCVELSPQSELSLTEIDEIIWIYCRDGGAEICTKQKPKCNDCAVRGVCLYNRSKCAIDIKDTVISATNKKLFL